ncbi:SDR family oxidoreductase [Sneathiella sp.]|uniref:SDR family oxidoreductase n=1 Tax=Sneathiella sp. TaxID=1964365 RepID=UPI002FE2318E
MPSPEKSIIITGASRGIGRAIALKAAAEGYAVCVNYATNAGAADEVVRKIEAAGGLALAVQADVSREEDILHLFAVVDGAMPPLGALVNNAGIVDAAARLDEMDRARLERMFSTNITGPFLCAREAVRRLSTRHGGNGGAIINISSVAARLASPSEYVDYAASKAAVDTMTKGLAVEVAAEGVRVNCVRPGLIRTEIHASGGQPDRIERVEKVVPIRRAGEAEEVADVVLWLLSPQASYVTGALIDVAGGR